MKILRLILWACVAVVAAGASYTLLNQQTKPEKIQQAGVTKIGGPFSLIDHKGKVITQQDLLGKNHAIFFGFTNCPDICPATLLEVASWMKDLGTDSEKVNFYFFSVDPERDTPEILGEYVDAFDKRITGVTGNYQEMLNTIKAYKSFVQKVDLGEGDYTMDHSASVLLFKADGSFKGTISFGEKDEIALEKLRRLIKNS